VDDNIRGPSVGDDGPEGARLDRALRDVFNDVVREHREAGVPLLIWESGRVVSVAPDELPLEETPCEDAPGSTPSSLG